MKTRLSTATSLIHVLISIVVVGLLFSVNLTMAGQSSTDLPKEEMSNGAALDTQARVLQAFPPKYPQDAKVNNIEGRVIVRFVVDTEGKVQEPEIAEANPEGVFDQSALDAIVQYEFEPALKDGIPVNCLVTMPIMYSLGGPEIPGMDPSEMP